MKSALFILDCPVGYKLASIRREGLTCLSSPNCLNLGLVDTIVMHDSRIYIDWLWGPKQIGPKNFFLSVKHRKVSSPAPDCLFIFLHPDLTVSSLKEAPKRKFSIGGCLVIVLNWKSRAVCRK